MSCLVALLALLAPRLTIVLLVVFSDYVGNATETVLWPLLGFLFMPLTLLAYALAINANGSVSGIYLVLVVIAVLADLGLFGSGARTTRTRVVETRKG